MNVHNAAKKKRLVSGLREVAKAIRLGKAKTIVVTPNIEKIEAEGGLDDLLTSILEQAQQTNCPIVFALSRKKLGQIFGCRKKMSAIAILDYAGAEELYREMEQLAQEGRSQWEAYRSEGKTPPPADDLEASAEDSLAQGQSLSNGSPMRAPDAENDTANSLPSPADSGHKSLSQGLTS
jgi:selenocysteine insertion sequence-binding protein 2